MANLWFTSDSHFGHANIIQYSNRPFKDVREMNETLVKLWNEYVRPQDHIYHLGDLCMNRPKYSMEILSRLQGHKRLIRGNHDIYKTKEYLEAGFEEIYGVRVLNNLLMTHIPVHPSSIGRFRANVHGHIHNSRPEAYPPVLRMDKKTQKVEWVPYINISVEATNYRPVSMEELDKLVAEASAR